MPSQDGIFIGAIMYVISRAQGRWLPKVQFYTARFPPWSCDIRDCQFYDDYNLAREIAVILDDQGGFTGKAYVDSYEMALPVYHYRNLGDNALR